MGTVRDEKTIAWLFGSQPPTSILPAVCQQQPNDDDSSTSESTIRNYKKSSSVVGSAPSPGWATPAWENDEDSGDAWAGSPAAPEDIRHQIAPENKMVVWEGRIMQSGKEEKHQDEVLESEEFRAKFILGWREKVPASKTVSMTPRNILRRSSCDIDTETSAYMKKISQPVTKRDDGEYQECSMALRQHRDVWTSRVRAAHYNHRRKEAAKEAAKKPKRLEPMAAPEGYVFADDGKPAVEDDDCVLRPAIAKDMVGVARIYNYEVFNTLRAWDTEEVPVSDFVGILNECQRKHLPFLVAVRQAVDLVDASVWPSQAAHHEYMQHQRHCNAVPDETETVLGFVFLQSLDGGFGRGKHVGDMSCRMTLFVDPEHRKKHIGSALIDRTLMCMARTHPGNAVLHKWESAGHHPYNDAEMHRMARFLPNRIVIEGLFSGKKDPDYEWFDKMLAPFRFIDVGHVEGAYSTRRGMRSECLDKFIWMYMSQMHPEADSGDQADDVKEEREDNE